MTNVTDVGPVYVGPPLRGRTVRPRLSLALCLLFLSFTALFSLIVGSRGVSFETVLESFRAFDPRNDEHLVVWSLRLPRLLIALLAGAALGVSGAMMQAITRNPLAEPGLLGVNAGAAAAVILAISLGGLTGIHQYVWWGFAGAGMAGATVFVVGRGRAGSANPLRLVLVGAALAIALGSLIGIVVLNAPTAVLDDFRNWSAGALDGRDMHVAAVLGCCVVLGLVICMAIASSLNAIALGDELSRALGVDLRNVLLLCCLAIMLLAGSATAAAGPIGFIGLMAPHLARHLGGPDQRWILLLSGLLAAQLLLLADIIGRLVAAPSEVAAGTVTSLVGGPVFLLIFRRVRAGAP